MQMTENILTFSFRIFHLHVFLSFNVTAERKAKRTTQSSFVFQEDYLHHKQRLKPIVVCHSAGLVTSHRHWRNEEGTFFKYSRGS